MLITVTFTGSSYSKRWNHCRRPPRDLPELWLVSPVLCLYSAWPQLWQKQKKRKTFRKAIKTVEFAIILGLQKQTWVNFMQTFFSLLHTSSFVDASSSSTRSQFLFQFLICSESTETQYCTWSCELWRQAILWSKSFDRSSY